MKQAEDFPWEKNPEKVKTLLRKAARDLPDRLRKLEDARKVGRDILDLEINI